MNISSTDFAAKADNLLLKARPIVRALMIWFSCVLSCLLGSNRQRRRLVAYAMLAFLSNFNPCVCAQQRDATAAAVRIDLNEINKVTVRVISGNDSSSGAIVTSSGLVLTVAHGINADRGTLQIQLTDGRVIQGTLLRHNKTSDVAVVQMNDDSQTAWPFAQLAAGDLVKKDDVVLSLGFPGRTTTEPTPTARLGRVMSVDRDVIRSSCTLTVGDSGGPLLNSLGQLIGIHRQIGIGKDSNLHVSVAVALQELQKAGFKKPLDSEGKASGPLITPSQLQPSPEVLAELRKRFVEIRSVSDPNHVVAGTLITSDLIVTKLSELLGSSEVQCRGANFSAQRGQVISFDRESDLAVIRLAEANTSSIIDKPISGEISTGTIVFSLNEQQSAVCGIVAFSKQNEPRRPGRLGARFVVDSSGHIIVDEVLPNGAASNAGLKAGDRLMAVDGNAINTLEDVSKALDPFQPGDHVQLDTKRDSSEPSVLSVPLQHDAGDRFEKNEFLDGRSGVLSSRRTGFDNLIQHDIALSPNQCGGPICDSTGQLIGINIARRSREASLAIPIKKVLDVIQAGATSKPDAQSKPQ